MKLRKLVRGWLSKLRGAVDLAMFVGVIAVRSRRSRRRWEELRTRRSHRPRATAAGTRELGQLRADGRGAGVGDEPHASRQV